MSNAKKSVHPEFVEWLQSEKNLKLRSARDVKSHLLRAGGFIDVNDMTMTEPEVTYGLSKSQDFRTLSTSTRSHLKRAVRLYQEYIREILNEQK